jgi:hypothetical protein
MDPPEPECARVGCSVESCVPPPGFVAHFRYLAGIRNVPVRARLVA